MKTGLSLELFADKIMPASTVTSYTERENCSRNEIKSNQKNIKCLLILDEFYKNKSRFRYMEADICDYNKRSDIFPELKKKTTVMTHEIC